MLIIEAILTRKISNDDWKDTDLFAIAMYNVKFVFLPLILVAFMFYLLLTLQLQCTMYNSCFYR